MDNTSLHLLNKEQKEAVEHTSGPLLIVAGAGTGKTTVVTERISYLVKGELAKPEEILALTFTEKAAKEMVDRVDATLPYGTFGLWILTFHSFADRVLRAEALQIGLSPNFKLMTAAETYLFVKKNFFKFDLKYFRPSGNPFKFIEGMIQHFDRLRDEDTNPKQYKKIVNELVTEDEEGKEKFQELAKAYETYENLKAQEGVMDFSDLLTNTLKLFRTRGPVLKKYSKQFKYILVDEFQDTNFAQYELIKLLTPPEANPNLTVVGDDSQSIYKFRGAAISNILSFMKDYDKAKQIILTTNYRSSKTILDAAYRLIKHNDPYTLEAQLKISKNLTPGKKIPNEPIGFHYGNRVEDEAEALVKEIKDLKKSDKTLEWKDFAILVRANSHGEPFMRALERARIPSQFLGPGMLFRQPEIKDLIAYLKVLCDFTDSLSLYRVLSMEMWNISGRDLVAALAFGKKNNFSLFEALEKVSEIIGVSDESVEKVTAFIEMVHRHQGLLAKETAGQILFFFLEESGLLKTLIDFKTVDEEKRATNITKFFDKLKTFESSHEDSSVFALIDYVDLAMSVGESPLAAEIDWTENNAISILTVHSAKGLEFPVVFLPNLVEGRFPSRERREPIPIPDAVIHEILPEGDYHLQEERRLFYVAMTRAEKRLIFSAANFYGDGKKERKLSMFITEAVGKEFVTDKVEKLKGAQLPLFEFQSVDKKKEANSEPSVHRVDLLSYSAIDTFQICPLHYKLKNILHIPSPMTSAQAMGNSMHLALRDFYESVINGEVKIGQKDEKEIAFKLLDCYWIKEGYSGKVHETEALNKARRFLEEYLKSDLHKSAKPRQLEKTFNFWVGSPSDHLKIIGKIDRVDDLGDGKAEIIDYKTGANIPTQRDLDKDMQMTIYALAATNKGILNKKIEDVTMSFYFFDAGKKVSTVRTAKQLGDAKVELLKIRDEIEQSDFACSHSLFCQNCEFKMLCNG